MITENDRTAFKKFMQKSEAMLARQGIRIITRVQCIRCGAQFTEEQLELIDQHLEVCRIACLEKKR